MIHPSAVLRHVNDHIGYGLFAAERIPRGTIIWALDALDFCFSPREVRALPPLLQHEFEFYSFRNGDGHAVLCWDRSKYVNHSCRPTQISPGLWRLEIALRDIEQGEQLTDDYGTLNLEAPMPCSCGEPGCRSEISLERAVDEVPAWDALVAEAVRDVMRVEQPLGSLIAPTDRDALAAAASGAALPSTRSLLLGQARSRRGANSVREVAASAR